MPAMPLSFSPRCQYASAPAGQNPKHDPEPCKSWGYCSDTMQVSCSREVAT